ncbi:MAG: hypothetical protein LBI86_11890 [Treponema sp.]|jgi:hypothetical protein|nr:hypothetical protein [Treponema sp.]
MKKTTLSVTVLPGVCVIVLFMAGSVTVRGQTAAEMDRLLDAGEITCGEAAWFTLASTEDNPPSGPAAAFTLAMERGMFPKNTGSGRPLTMGGLSLLMMKTFKIEGGLMYRLFPGVRYAYREMTRQGFMEGRAYPNLRVSGEQFLFVLGTLLSRSGDAERLEAAAARNADAEPFMGNAEDHQGLSAGAEPVQDYEYDFELE